MAAMAAQGGGMPGGMGADPQSAQAAAEAKMCAPPPRALPFRLPALLPPPLPPSPSRPVPTPPRSCPPAPPPLPASGAQSLTRANPAHRAQEEQRTHMLQACITNGARERLARIALVKPEKARAVEDSVLKMAQRGQIAEPVSEDRLVAMLEGSGGGSEGRGGGGRGPKITFQRRNMLDDDDW